MPAIRINRQLLALAGNGQLAMERNSPLLSEPGETGSTTQAFRIAKLPANSRALGYPERFDQRNGRPELLEVEALDDAGNGVTTGNLRFRGLDPQAYLYNLEFGDSAVMAKLKACRLQGLRLGGPRQLTLPGVGPINPFDLGGPAAYMQYVVEHWPDYDFTFAPFSNNDHDGRWKSYVDSMSSFATALPGSPRFVPEHIQNINTWSSYVYGNAKGGSFEQRAFPFTVMGLPGLTPPTTPLEACIICPLPKLEYVVRALFKELRLELETDVFNDPEMQRLVLVPVTGVLNYDNQPGSTDFTCSLSLSQHLPDLNGAEFIRQLMDTFGWAFDGNGSRCHLLRAAPPLLNGNPVELTPLVGPGITVEPQEPVSIIVQPNVVEADAYASEWSEQPNPAAILAPVATVADLPAPAVAGVYRLVQQLRRYYVSEAETKTVGTGTGAGANSSTTTLFWQPGPFYLPGQQVGTAESSSDYTPGIAAVLTCQVQIGLPRKQVDVLCFLEPGYTTATAELTPATTSQPGGYTVVTTATRSRSLRLAFYRGLQPIVGAKDTQGNQATIPWLTQSNRAPDGSIIGNLSLEVHGKAGLANQQLLPLLALKVANTVVKVPANLTARQFTQLDFARLVSVQGNEFMLKRASLTLPVTKPGQLELIPRGQVASITSRATVSDGFYTVAGVVAGVTCALLIDAVQQAADVATIITSGAAGHMRYQLNAGALQDSNIFTGLVSGTTYTFWAYDMGVVGCNQSKTILW